MPYPPAAPAPYPPPAPAPYPPNKKAPARFELAISCLLDRRFNQLSHGASVVGKPKNNLLFKLDTQISSIFLLGAVSVVVITSALHAEGRQFQPGTAPNKKMDEICVSSLNSTH